MNAEQKVAHLRALRAVHAKMQDWQDQAAYGICAHYERELERDGVGEEEIVDLSFHLRDEFGKWDNFSGSTDYPVPPPHPTEDPARAAGRAYHLSYEFSHIQMAAEKWDRQNSPYAAMRWELLEWLIERAEADQ